MSGLTDAEFDNLAELIAAARDKAPRLPGDADSWDVLAAIEQIVARHVTAALTAAASAIETRRHTYVQSGGLPELIPSNHADAERLGHLDGLAAAAEIVRALAQPNPNKETS